METLVSHAINGYNAMPAKGGCASCPDEEIEVAVKYIVEDSQ
jgi:cytochrome c5